MPAYIIRCYRLMFLLLLGIQQYMHLQPGVFNLAAGDMPQRDIRSHPPSADLDPH